ncbi:DUF4423 domain-containing protein [Bacteriovoracaceae bacterium]|nr:DUF4423 domain-containing protein [Bacteriovoracaceae bacterium]
MIRTLTMKLGSYREIIQEEFNFRVQSNSSYSLRAFARDLKIYPSQLSDILKSKSGLSGKKAYEIALQMGMCLEDSLYFKALVEMEHGRNSVIVNQAKKFLESKDYAENFIRHSDDQFKIISEWYHFAILSVMELDRYDGTIKFIQKELGLEVKQVKQAMLRLCNLNYVEMIEQRFVVKEVMLATTNEVPSKALKFFHRQHLQKSMSAIDEISVELRDITSMTMAIDVEKINDAKNMIKKFRRELCRFMEGGKKNSVYNLNIQLVPLSEKKGNQ